MTLTSRGEQQPFPQTQPDGITTVNTYQQALQDFGVLEVRDRLTQLNQSTSLSEGELDSLTALVIRQLANNLNQPLVSDSIKAIQLDNSVSGLVPLSFKTSVPRVSLPANFPNSAQTPYFLYGDRIKWKPLSNTDPIETGVIIGRFYAFAHHQNQWAWKYLVFLDCGSYSYHFCTADTAWEEDIEPLD